MGNDAYEAMVRFGAAALAAGAAEVSTLPIDIAKVRLQTQTLVPGQPAMYRNMFHAGYRIAATEGRTALWKGLSPALLRQCSYTGLTFVLYEPIRNKIAGEGVRMEDISFVKRVMAGGVAGGVSIFTVNPTDVIKTRMQTATRAEPLAKIVVDIYRRNGVRGFWMGWSPNVIRSFIGNACELGCYDYFKNMIKKRQWVEDGPALHLVSSFGSGSVSALCSTPVDVVKTRLMSQAGKESTDAMYTGVMNAFLRIGREEGMSAFYKGFAPLAARKILWTVAYFMCYEATLNLTKQG